jgi:hypothetical protein
MMSDGEAAYPEKEVQDIKNSEIFKKNKIKFTAIGYGDSDFSVLEKIAKDLKGKLEEVAKPSELELTFFKLAANAYNAD